jgi:zinc and cadmium transporter
MTASAWWYSFLIFLTAFSGGACPLVVAEIRELNLRRFVALGAGLLLGMSFVHLLPEASELLPHAFGGWFLFGFVLMLILEKFIMVHACDEHGCHYHTVGLAAFAGLTVHGIIEGVALASTLLVSKLGPLVLVAILAHKAPSGLALTSILKMSGKTHRQILVFVIGVALSGPLGLLLAYNLLRAEPLPSAAGALLAVSAGTFLYIGACDLLPELHSGNEDKLPRLGAFLLGLVLSFVSGYFLELH